MPSNRKRRHHTVPKFYLRQFADDRDQLIRVALPGDKRHPVSVLNATVEKDFYLAELDDGTLVDDPENALVDIETAGANAIRAIVSGGEWPLRPENRAAISLWAALQILRTPAARQIGSEVANVAFKRVILSLGRNGFRERLKKMPGYDMLTGQEVDDLWVNLTDSYGYLVTPSRNQFFHSIADLLEDMDRALFEREWRLVRFEESGLLTSDNPVAKVPGRKYPSVEGVGYARVAAVMVPISRRTLLIMGSRGFYDRPARVGGGIEARYANQLTANNAWKAVFHHPDDDPIGDIKLPNPRGHELK